MAISDYASLVAALPVWAWRQGDTEFAAAMPDCITGCEHVLNFGAGAIDPLRVAEMETVSTADLTDGEVLLPTDYLQFRAIRGVGSYNIDLELRDPSWIDAKYPITTGRCIPFVSISNGTLTCYHSGVTSITLDYYAKIPAITSENTTNWLLTKAPMVYLFGTLTQAAPFMADADRMQMFGTMFAQAVAGLQKSDMGARYARVVSRVRGATP